jgi:hypothetical protein
MCLGILHSFRAWLRDFHYLLKARLSFYVLLTVPLDIIVWWKTNLMHNLFLVYFVKLYMFRTYLGPSSGGTTICIQQLVLIILFRWLSVVLRTTDSQRLTKYTKNKLYIKLVFLHMIRLSSLFMFLAFSRLSVWLCLQHHSCPIGSQQQQLQSPWNTGNNLQIPEDLSRTQS